MSTMRDVAYRNGRSLIRAFSSIRWTPSLVLTLNYRHDLKDIPEVEGVTGSEIRRLQACEIPLLLEVWPVQLEKMYQRLERGDRCYGLFLDGRIAHYQWYQLQGRHFIQPAGRWMKVQKGEMVGYHVRVADWARGRHVNLFVKTCLLREFKEEGFQSIWVYTTVNNVASQKGIEGAGWVFDEGYKALHFGSFRFPLPSTLKTKPIPTAVEHGPS